MFGLVIAPKGRNLEQIVANRSLIDAMECVKETRKHIVGVKLSLTIQPAKGRQTLVRFAGAGHRSECVHENPAYACLSALNDWMLAHRG